MAMTRAIPSPKSVGKNTTTELQTCLGIGFDAPKFSPRLLRATEAASQNLTKEKSIFKNFCT